ncbi:MAG: TIGR00341 family protein [Bacteroidetes bacterium]|nr:MAG: TIGR00341 family protein [Bacteroidota bacterium]
MRLSQTERMEASKVIAADAKLDVSYLLINAISTIVACSGLLANSIGVIIGSMLIATLLSPIAGIALSLAEKNLKGTVDCIKTLLCGVLLVTAIAYLYGLFFPHIRPTDRMLARTDPGIFDVIIAFFGGIAGGISLLFKRYKMVMIGVGIATALVPPLSTAGIFLAKANFHYGFKAIQLALINITFITVANFLVFKYFGINSKIN